MSFSKIEIDNIYSYIEGIKNDTLKSEDISIQLEALDRLMDVSELYVARNFETSFYFNEIKADMVSILVSAISGNYRLAICGLRGVLELACHSFYYPDHIVEFRIFNENNEQATRYVTALISNDSFYTTKYICSFRSDSVFKEVKENAFSERLKLQYKKLCDYVHGRGNSFMKRSNEKIEYDSKYFSDFSCNYLNVISLIILMYELRYSTSGKVVDFLENSKYLKSVIVRK
ncbi:hypothetical protein N5094_04560 [Shewanella putrefaciens]|uniref:hypothetical protein n=1 Tax=Shewanella putrefaciens TaxID=24 RepID=UPI0021BE8364|nr:hypothetical protein [Shewanella putrefaciens]UXK09517.1 hypothetical protein N5094_04560 [Shewanella putrefaciens]